MKFVKGIEKFDAVDCAVTIGKFDALHRGHKLLIDNIKSQKSLGLKSVVICFSVSPRIILNNSQNRDFIITDEERVEMLSDMGVDYLLELKFDEETIRMEPEVFVDLLVKKLSMKYLTVGCDFRFGYKGRGDANLLSELSRAIGFEFKPENKLTYKEAIISSTRIRETLLAGNVAEADHMLGYDFFLEGEIICGNRIGTKLSFPTINIIPQPQKLLLPNGVYATKTLVNGTVYDSVTNIGLRPTIRENKKKIISETHLFGFSGDLYGKHAKVYFIERIRDEKKFESMEELKSQISMDKEYVRELFNGK